MKNPLVKKNATVARVIVTPIIDVALVLVIILLITAPMLSVADLEVTLPQARTRDAEDDVHISVTLSKTGELALDEDVIDPESLAGMLGAKLSKGDTKNMLVVVRADAGIPYRTIRKILQEARRAGATRLAIATRQSGKGSL